MPSLRHRVPEIGLAAISAVGLTLVVYARLGPDKPDPAAGLALLVIGAFGMTIRCVRRAGTAGQAQRREILGTIEQVKDGGGLSVESEALRRGWDELAAERAQFEARRTEFYAQAVAETLHALGESNKGHVKLLLPKQVVERAADAELCRSGTEGKWRHSEGIE